MNQLSTITEVTLLETNDQKAIVSGFDGFEAIANEWKVKAESIVVTDIAQKDIIAQAKDARKFIQSKRLEIENIHKQLKEQSLRKGQAIDAIKRYLLSLIEPIEEHLKEQEKFVEIQEAKIKEELRQARLEKLAPYEFDPIGIDLGTISEESFTKVLDNAKTIFEAKQEELRALEEEKKRKAEEEERLRKENEQLRELQQKKDKEATQKLNAQREKDRLVREKQAELANKKLAIEQEKARRIQAKRDEENKKKIDEIQKKIEAEKVARIELQKTLDKSAIKVTKDGDQFCVLCGPNVQEGISGFGETVGAAITQFSVNWLLKKGYSIQKTKAK